MKTYTPAPWAIENPPSGITEITAGRYHIAEVGQSVRESTDEASANARLISATPDLLNALEIAEATIQRLAPDGSRATQGTRDVIRAAITKAGC